MSTEIKIEQISDYVGQTVTIQGWLYAKTGKGKLQFLRLRDGTGIVQCVAFRPEVGDELFELMSAPQGFPVALKLGYQRWNPYR